MKPKNTVAYTGHVHPVQMAKPRLRLVLALLAVIALFSSSLEIEILEHLDSLSHYMTYREIAIDAGVALIVVLFAGLLWWAAIFVVADLLVKSLPVASENAISLAWSFGLAFPVAYFLADLSDSVVLNFHPQHRPLVSVWAILGICFLAISLLSLLKFNVAKIQHLCSSRLAPIGYFHVALALLVIVALPALGVRRFHNYRNPIGSINRTALPDIYVISFDALRASNSSVYGYDRETTPNLEKFASRSTTFDYFFSNSNFTTPATASIETGLLPWTHRILEGGGFLRHPDATETLPSVLRKHGYYTAMISSNFFATPPRHRTTRSYDAVEYIAPSNLSGLWSEWTNLTGTNTQYTLAIPLLRILTGIREYLDAFLLGDTCQFPPDAVFSEAKSLIAQTDSGQPRFIWMHILPPHSPYIAPSPFLGKFEAGKTLRHNSNFLEFRNTLLPSGTSASQLEGRYDEMILYGDRKVGDFLDWLDQTGRLKSSMVIILSDHGESFEHGWYSHTGPYLYDGLIHVPLLIHLPGQTRGTHNPQLAQQADLMPTILDFLGFNTPVPTDGISLLPALTSQREAQRYVFTMNLEHNSVFTEIKRGTVAVIDDQFKYVNYLDRHEESLFRYRSDAQDERNIAISEPAVTAHFRQVLNNKLQEVNKKFIDQQ